MKKPNDDAIRRMLMATLRFHAEDHDRSGSSLIPSPVYDPMHHDLHPLAHSYFGNLADVVLYVDPENARFPENVRETYKRVIAAIAESRFHNPASEAGYDSLQKSS